MRELADLREASDGEVADLRAQLDRLRESHAAELLSAETIRQQALAMAQQEHAALRERVELASRAVEDGQTEADRTRREAGLRADKDRARMEELQIEVDIHALSCSA